MPLGLDEKKAARKSAHTAAPFRGAGENRKIVSAFLFQSESQVRMIRVLAGQPAGGPASGTAERERAKRPVPQVTLVVH